MTKKRKSKLWTKIRRFWRINPRNRIRTNKKKYNRKKAKQKLRKRLKDENRRD